MFKWLTDKTFGQNNIEKKAKTLGQLGEEYAQEVYKKRGYEIIAANFFNKKGVRKGEIDFVATDSEKIVFVEVKTRAREKGKFGFAAESVDGSKQRKLLKAVQIFLLQNPKFTSRQPRIDVCVLQLLDPTRLILKQVDPPTYEVRGKLDNTVFSVKILVNAVEDSS